MTTNKQFKLYGSEGCHLCELAQVACFEVISPQQVELVDIVDDEQLVELYGTSIPVLERLADGAKLFWPFDITAIANLKNTRHC